MMWDRKRSQIDKIVAHPRRLLPPFYCFATELSSELFKLGRPRRRRKSPAKPGKPLLDFVQPAAVWSGIICDGFTRIREQMPLAEKLSDHQLTEGNKTQIIRIGQPLAAESLRSGNFWRVGAGWTKGLKTVPSGGKTHETLQCPRGEIGRRSSFGSCHLARYVGSTPTGDTNLYKRRCTNSQNSCRLIEVVPTGWLQLSRSKVDHRSAAARA